MRIIKGKVSRTARFRTGMRQEALSQQTHTYQVSGLTLQDGGQDIVEADRTLEQAGQVAVGGCGA